jgi:hypothetical protein
MACAEGDWVSTRTLIVDAICGSVRNTFRAAPSPSDLPGGPARQPRDGHDGRVRSRAIALLGAWLQTVPVLRHLPTEPEQRLHDTLARRHNLGGLSEDCPTTRVISTRPGYHQSPAGWVVGGSAPRVSRERWSRRPRRVDARIRGGRRPAALRVERSRGTIEIRRPRRRAGSDGHRLRTR